MNFNVHLRVCSEQNVHKSEIIQTTNWSDKNYLSDEKVVKNKLLFMYRHLFHPSLIN